MPLTLAQLERACDYAREHQEFRASLGSSHDGESPKCAGSLCSNSPSIKMVFSPMARKEKAASASKPNAVDVITSIKYPAKRKNIPPAGIEAQGVLREAPRIRYEYNPHLPTL